MGVPDALKDKHRRSSATNLSLGHAHRSPKRQRPSATHSLPSIDKYSDPGTVLEKDSSRRANASHVSSTGVLPAGFNEAPLLAAKQTEAPPDGTRSSSPFVPAVPKRRFTRSKSGCNTCRQRKVKCDEARPSCRRCRQDGRPCHGYDEQQQKQSVLFPSQGSTPVPTANSVRSTFEPVSTPPDGQPHFEQHMPPLLSKHGWTNSLASVATHPDLATSPQHLDDWIDLLCSSIGNDIAQQTGASNSRGNVAGPSESLLDLKHGFQRLDAQAQQSHSSNAEKHDTTRNSCLAQEHGLSALASAAAGVAPTASRSNFPGWLNDEWLSIFTASPAISQQAGSGSKDTPSPSWIRPRLPTLDRISESDLQKRIRSLCVTKVQLESVSFFFNTTARCFHLLSADTNVWRIFFAQLASESPVILDLVACLGLTHLSLTQDHRKKGLAHAHFSRCKSEWDSAIGLLDSSHAIAHALSQITTAHRILEVLAGTILIAHIEQFGRGFATCSRSYTALAIAVIRRSLKSTSAPGLTELDRGPGSAFRFFVRILLWWETMSRTMGPASEQGDVLDIFEHVLQWEEPDNPDHDPIGCSTQCVVGWPIELLQAVERISRLSLEPEILAFQPRAATLPPLVLPSRSLSHALEGSISLQLQQQVDTIETHIRLARPMPLGQDDSIAAELRYLIFECLQSASLVYFCRMLLKSTDAVWFEIDKVTRFLERKQHRTDQTNATQTCRLESTSSGTVGSDFQLAQAMETRGKWWIRAPDGALIWAYFQCASEIVGVLDPSAQSRPQLECEGERCQVGSGKPVPLALGSQLALGSDVYTGFAQSRSERRQRCRTSLLVWERFDEIQCIFLCRHLLKAIWDRRDLYEQEKSSSAAFGTESVQARYDQATELRDICRQRRWKQPLIF